MLGFASWNALYVGTLATAPVTWLPAKLGYAGAVALQAALLLGLAALLLRVGRNARRRRKTGALTPGYGRRSGYSWPAGPPGWAASASGCSAFLPTCGPSRWASLPNSAAAPARWPSGSAGSRTGCPGLDGFAGCATVVIDALMTPNGLFILALVAGSLADGCGLGRFPPRAWPWHRYLLA
jgi:uncharacterized protein